MFVDFTEHQTHFSSTKNPDISPVLCPPGKGNVRFRPDCIVGGEGET